MDRNGFLDNVTKSVTFIYQGRDGLDTEGHTEEGRVNYHKGLRLGIDTFREIRALTSENLELPVACEYAFLNQELQFCAPTDDRVRTSLSKAVEDFDGAFLALDVLQNTEGYHYVDKAMPRRAEFRYKGMPKDAFHVACAGHRARVDNILKAPGINLLEKALLKERRTTMQMVQTAYLDKQRRALATA